MPFPITGVALIKPLQPKSESLLQQLCNDYFFVTGLHWQKPEVRAIRSQNYKKGIKEKEERRNTSTSKQMN